VSSCPLHLDRGRRERETAAHRSTAQPGTTHVRRPCRRRRPAGEPPKCHGSRRCREHRSRRQRTVDHPDRPPGNRRCPDVPVVHRACAVTAWSRSVRTRAAMARSVRCSTDRHGVANMDAGVWTERARAQGSVSAAQQMRAILQSQYGSADVLSTSLMRRPVHGPDEVVRRSSRSPPRGAGPTCRCSRREVPQVCLDGEPCNVEHVGRCRCDGLLMNCGGRVGG
jgi:hypothetical protein